MKSFFKLKKEQKYSRRIVNDPFWSWIISKMWDNEAELLLAYKKESDVWYRILSSKFEILFSIKYYGLKRIPESYINLAKYIFITQVEPLRSDFEIILNEMDELNIPLFFHRPKLKRRTAQFFESLDFLKYIVEYCSVNKFNYSEYSSYFKRIELRESWQKFHLAKKYLNTDIFRQIRRYDCVCNR